MGDRSVGGAWEFGMAEGDRDEAWDKEEVG